MSAPIRVDIENMAFGGDGVGRLPSGKVVFVPGAFPGDTVEIVLTHERPGFARARLHQIITPTPDRTAPACPASERCGGCAFWKLDAAAEWRWKQRSALDALTRIGRLDLSQVPVSDVPAPALTRYRRRLRLHLDNQGRLGFFAAASHTLSPLTDCLVAEPQLVSAAQSLRDELPVGLRGDLLLELGDAHRVVGVLSIKEGRARDIRAMSDTLKPLLASPNSLIAGIRVKSSDPEVKGEVVGDVRFTLQVDGYTRHLEAGVFTQANSAMNALLIAQIVNDLEPAPGDRVLELFSGWGNFSTTLAASGADVHGFDVARHAITLGKRDAGKLADRLPGSLTLSMRDLGRGLPTKHTRPGRYTKVLLDPPRSGAAAVVPGLLALGAKRIVYVSCNPATLGRDLGRLAAKGYTLSKLTLLDMFPRTAHMEMVAVLERSRKAST